MSPFSYVYVNGRRYYKDNDSGKTYVGVTTILSATASPETKARIAKWKMRCVKNGDSTEDPAERGTAVHSCIERIIKDEKYHDPKPETLPWIPTEYKPYISSLTTALSLIEAPILIEAPVKHPLGFAGTLDLLTLMKHPVTGEIETWLVDWKTSWKRKDLKYCQDYYLQAAAYCAALNRTYDYRVNRAKVVIANPQTKAQILSLEPSELLDNWNKFKNRLEAYYHIFPDSRPL